MSFLHSEVLYYLLPPFVILFYFLLTQKERQENFFSPEVMKKLRVSSDTMGMRARNILFFFVGLLIIIALAEPVIKDAKVEVKAKSADVMIALDISDSMLAEDLYPNRLEFAKQKAIDLLKLAPDERIGVVAFAKNSYLVSPMSFDHKAVSFLLDKLSTNSITEKGTDFISLLEVVNQTIQNKNKKYLLILSDGGDEEGFSKEISFAKENNIVVFVLGIGTPKGAPIKKEDGSFIKHKGEIIVPKLNEEIASFATSTGGVYIEAVKSNNDLKAMLREIESISEQKELKSETIDKFIPLFYYPLALALFLLLIATSSMYKKQHRVSSLFVLCTLFGVFEQNTYAGLLDFMELEKAKSTYEAGDFNISGEIYTNYAQSSGDSKSYYNAANALYKQEKYDEAIKSYEKATFDDNVSEANRYGNIGNSYVKQSTKESLLQAVESYEKSLQLHEDKEIRENLEAVKKALQEQEQQENKEQNQKESKEQEQKQEQNQEQQKNDSEQNEESQDSEKSKEDSKEQEQQNSQEENSAQNNQEEKDSEPQEQKTQQEQAQEQEKKQLEELEQSKEEQKGAQVLENAKENMSDAEEEKWIERLNTQQNTFMYQLNDKKSDEENSDAKPW